MSFNFQCSNQLYEEKKNLAVAHNATDKGLMNQVKHTYDPRRFRFHSLHVVYQLWQT